MSPYQLKVMRQLCGLSQQALADLVQIDRTAISRFELGKRPLKAEYRRRIELVLGFAAADELAADVIRSVKARKEAAAAHETI